MYISRVSSRRTRNFGFGQSSQSHLRHRPQHQRVPCTPWSSQGLQARHIPCAWPGGTQSLPRLFEPNFAFLGVRLGERRQEKPRHFVLAPRSPCSRRLEQGGLKKHVRPCGPVLRLPSPTRLTQGVQARHDHVPGLDAQDPSRASSSPLFVFTRGSA